MAKRQKAQKIDGLGTWELSRIHSAVRQVWQRGHSRRLVIKRCTGKDGFLRCESCKRKTPQIKVDHIEAVGKVGGLDYIQRMFVPSSQLQGLCKKCHDIKTRAERAAAKAPAQISVDAAIARKAEKAEEPICWVPEGQEAPPGFKGWVITLPFYKPRHSTNPAPPEYPYPPGDKKGHVQKDTPKKKRRHKSFNFTDEF